MRKVFLWLLIWHIAIGTAIGANHQERKKQPRNIILIGWDGAGRQMIDKGLSRGDLPNLKSLIAEGNLVAIDILRTTETKAGWSQILTGYEPEVTGVFSNRRFQPIPEGYTVFERLEAFFGSNEFVTIAVCGKKGNVGIRPPRRKRAQKENAKKIKKAGGQIRIENGVTYHVFPGEPFHNAKKSMDVFVNGLKKDKRVGRKTKKLLSNYRDKRIFAFVHFAEVDHQGHRHGENSSEYYEALLSADFWTGKIMDQLKALGLFEDTLIYITADHGFDRNMKSHRDAPYVFLATNDPQVMRRGERSDIAPTILDRFGLDTSKIEPPLDGHSLVKSHQAPMW